MSARNFGSRFTFLQPVFVRVVLATWDDWAAAFGEGSTCAGAVAPIPVAVELIGELFV